MFKKILETKIHIKILVFAGLISLVGFPNAFAADDRNSLQQKLNQIQQQINSYQQQISQTQKQSASLKNEISIYDNQIRSLELQIDANQTQQEDANLQITELQTQIDRRKTEIEENKKILAQLIVQLAQLDDNSFLQMGLGTDNFSTFLDQIQYTRSVNDQVYSLLSKIKEIKTKLEQQQADLKVELAKLEELQGGLKVSQDSLNDQRGQKESLLSKTKGIESNYQKLLSKSQSDEDKLQQEISDLDKAAGSKVSNKIIPSKGVLSWPMDGVMTQGYGNTGFTSLGYNFHNGIDLAAPAGKPIYAAADGTVANCDTGEAAYGNWCTIRHTVSTKNGPRNIVTLYGHMRTFVAHPGQKVSQGDLIGYEGNTGNTTRLIYGPERGYHLHFTVFDAQGYTVTKGAYTSIYGSYSVPSGYTYNPIDFLGK
jgi:murein DD-endopeptidase MepM/ murein hydrolase activator NlpD